MSKVVISFMSDSDKAVNPDTLFGILDIEKEKFEQIKFSDLPDTNNLVHGMGICYNQGKYFCAGIIPNRFRLASNILTINLETGERKMTKLNFTKAIHGLRSIDANRLLANSTQNDIISELIMENGVIINEDFYRFFVPDIKWKEYTNMKINCTGKKINYRAAELVDDNHHVNSIEVDKNDFYCTMFGAMSWESWGNTFRGLLYNMTKEKVVLDNLDQPHTAYVDTLGNICCCNSSQFTFIVKDKFTVTLDGYTRGVYEDTEKKGYWIGISAYRKKRLDSKWVEKYRGEQPLEGARIQFVSYEGEIGNTIELKNYGKEIFDLLQYREGIWNVK